MRQGSDVTANRLEIILSGLLGVYLSKTFPNEDFDLTRLRELGEEEHGLLVSLVDKEFRILVEEIS